MTIAFRPPLAANPEASSARGQAPDSAMGMVKPAFSLQTVPFVPEAVLRVHRAYVPSDDRFTAACRLLAALWRQDMGLCAGTYLPESRRARSAATALGAGATEARAGMPIRLGSRLAPAATRAGATFLTPAIAAHVRAVLLFREPGALFEETRLWSNLLSSQALTLNLLAPLALDHDLATAVFRQLLPGFVGRVAGIRFEHSPGRRGPEYFGDGTALDALVDLVTPEGEPAFIAIEVKYVEGMCGPLPPPRPRYVEAARESGLYCDPDAAVLTRAGFEQLRREHVMAQLMVRHGLAGRGHFLLIGPALNRRVHTVAERYTEELIDGGEAASDRVGFGALTLERVVTTIAEAGAADLAAAFTARYLDLGRVAGHVLAQPVPGLPRAGRAARTTRPTEGERNDATAPTSKRKSIRSPISPADAPNASTPTRHDVSNHSPGPKQAMSTTGSTIRRGA